MPQKEHSNDRIKKHIVIIMAASIVLVLVAILIVGKKIEPLDGGTYINNQYGFSIKFPASWNGKYVIEEQFDRIVVRNRKIAFVYGENKGTLLTIYILENNNPICKPFYKLGSIDDATLVYEICWDEPLTGIDEKIQREYTELRNSISSFIQEAFSPYSVTTPEIILQVMTEKNTKNLLAYLDASDEQSLKEACQLLPFGQLLCDCALKEQGTYQVAELYYDAKAIEAYNGLMVGDISHRIADTIFTLFKNADAVRIDYNGDCQLGYTRSEMQTGLVEAAELGVTPFMCALTQPPSPGRLREYGEVNRTAVTVQEAVVQNSPNPGAEFCFLLPQGAPVTVLRAAGAYCYVEWRYTDQYDAQGYLPWSILSFNSVDIQQARFGYSENAVLLSASRDAVAEQYYRGAFEILEYDGDMAHIQDISGEEGWISTAQIIYDACPYAIQLRWEDLAEVYQLGILQAYLLDLSLNQGIKEAFLDPAIGEKMPDPIRKAFVMELEKDTGLQIAWGIAGQDATALYFSLDTETSQYTKETALLKVLKQRGTTYMTVESLLQNENGQWRVTNSVLTETK